MFYQNKFSLKMQYFLITLRATGNVGKWMWTVRPRGLGWGWVILVAKQS